MTRRLASPSTSEAGYSLVELLIAIAILGVGVTTVLGGMMTSITVSDLGRRQAEGQGAVRTMAEAIVGDTYADCATSYPATGFSSPAGYTVTQTVSYWDGTAFVPTCGTDSGLQRVEITVGATDGRGAETLAFAKRKP